MLCDVDKIYAVDNNPSQIYLAELKKAAISKLTYSEFASLMGLNKGDRIKIYTHIRQYLPQTVKTYWDNNLGFLKKGLLYCGLTERKIRFFSQTNFSSS